MGLSITDTTVGKAISMVIDDFVIDTDGNLRIMSHKVHDDLVAPEVLLDGAGDGCDHPEDQREPLPYQGKPADPDEWECGACGTWRMTDAYERTRQQEAIAKAFDVPITVITAPFKAGMTAANDAMKRLGQQMAQQMPVMSQREADQIFKEIQDELAKAKTVAEEEAFGLVRWPARPKPPEPPRVVAKADESWLPHQVVDQVLRMPTEAHRARIKPESWEMSARMWHRIAQYGNAPLTFSRHSPVQIMGYPMTLNDDVPADEIHLVGRSWARASLSFDLP